MNLPRNLNVSPPPVFTVKVTSSSFEGDIQQSVNSITPRGPFFRTSSGYLSNKQINKEQKLSMIYHKIE